MDSLAQTCELRRPDAFYGVDSADNEWRLKLREVYQQLRQTGTKAFQCSLIDLFFPGTLRVLSNVEKNSASDSIILMGTIMPPSQYRQDAEFMHHWSKIKCDVVVKVSFPDLENVLESRYLRSRPNQYASMTPEQRAAGRDPLTVELQLYSLLSQMLLDYITPNVMAYYGNWLCTIDQAESETNALIESDPNNPTFQREASQMAEFADSVRNIFAQNQVPFTTDSKLRFVLLEKGRGDSLENLLSQNAITDRQLRSILFQIIYTMHVLGERGIRHGDLHPGNVFVDPLANNRIELAYFIFEHQAEFAQIPTEGVLAKIFDWDRGSINRTPHKPKSSLHWPPGELRNRSADYYCDSTSSCNYNPKADIYTLLSSVYLLINGNRRYSGTKTFIERQIQPTLLDNGSPQSRRSSSFSRSGGFQFRLCKGPLLAFQTSPDSTTCELQPSGFRCDGAWLPPDCAMSAPRDMLRDDTYFGDVWKPYPQYSPTTPYVYGDWQSLQQRTAILRDISARWPHEHRERLARLGLI